MHKKEVIPINTFKAIAEGTKMSDGVKYDRGLYYYLCDISIL